MGEDELVIQAHAAGHVFTISISLEDEGIRSAILSVEPDATPEIFTPEVMEALERQVMLAIAEQEKEGE